MTYDKFCSRALPASTAMYGSARAGVQREEKNRRWGHLHLLVIAGGLEDPAPLQERGVQINRALHRRPIDRCCDAVQLRMGSVQKDHAPLRKQMRVQTSESRAEGPPRTVRISQKVRDRLITQQGSSFFEYGKNFVAHLYRTHGRIRDAVTRRTEGAAHAFRPWKGHV